ncbi:RNA-binding protein [Caldanaerobacter subterraneus subsp. yonseiensis KB-1]|uniref:Rqc2 homolog RqcH n=1 Tax=Caldanaerobacter subterraneus subsp. yonseiensis KB-1 TaxID=1388761 RepID=U5CRI9_CALSX|nr:NFACT RNA binding domain-containing protein [Caldanaerobacter subterraneus]ERM90752.1 RNA-binding protein [Caldanaerobacter subterraneus subsp. yonseiensis KB-1]
MAFDGVTLHAIVKELKKEIEGGRIEKIYQPEKEDLIFTIRSKGKNYKLLLSANANYPRIHLTKEDRENPLEPPMFCMLLRKHLQNGRIAEIRQVEFDRIVEIDIETKDELQNQAIKTLVVEIMGRHSNVILIDKASQTILDSIKRVYPDMSKVREVLPGKKYTYPPLQQKLSLKDLTYESFKEALLRQKTKKIEKALVEILQGFSTTLSSEVSFQCSISDSFVETLGEEKIEQIYKKVRDIYEKVYNLEVKPCVVFLENKVADFSCIELTQYKKRLLFDTVNEAADKFFFEKIKSANFQMKSSDLKKIVQNILEKLYVKLNKLQEELAEADKAEIYKLYGELLTVNLHSIKKGLEKFRTINYYTGEEIEIPLDKRLSPSQNAQMYYKKYNKLKNAFNTIKKQISETLEEINYLEGQLINIENSTTLEELEEIKNELIEEGYIHKHQKKKVASPSLSQPLHVVSSEGFDIYVGKNNRQNDYLTLKLANPNDIWLHTKDIPGAHVVIKTNNSEVPESTLVEAAKLAAKYSKAKYSSNVPVDYTLKKYVKKPPGSKPGFVIYTNHKTIYVNPE